MTSKTSVVMINRNGGERLGRSLGSCRRALEKADAAGLRFEFILLDNGSTDGSCDTSRQVLSSAQFDWRIEIEPIAGVNFARNAAIRVSDGASIVFCDGDLEFSQDWLISYSVAFETYPEISVFAGRILIGDVEGSTPAWLDLDGAFARPSIVGRVDNGTAPGCFALGDSSVAGPVGANMAFRRSVFDEAGTFDTRFGLRPGSSVPGAEAEYFHRLSRRGHRFAYVPEALARHPVRADQLSRKYFLRRLHGTGRVFGRIQKLNQARCRRVGGVTLYVFEHIGKASWRYVRSYIRDATPAEKFYRRGDIAIHLGHLHEDLATGLGFAAGRYRPAWSVLPRILSGPSLMNMRTRMKALWNRRSGH